jgi:GGDEF domain-containing protein
MYKEKRNYIQLMDDFNEEITKSDTPIIIALIDIDNFHLNNTDPSYLGKIYNLLKLHLPDLMYLGKDEFAFLVSGKRVEDILLRLTLSKNTLEHELNTTFSAGIVEYPKHGTHINEILRDLEQSVYNAKDDGKNRIYFANESKMKLKSNYYTLTQLKRLNELSKKLDRSEASLLRESLDVLFRKYEE